MSVQCSQQQSDGHPVSPTPDVALLHAAAYAHARAQWDCADDTVRAVASCLDGVHTCTGDGAAVHAPPEDEAASAGAAEQALHDAAAAHVAGLGTGGTLQVLHVSVTASPRVARVPWPRGSSVFELVPSGVHTALNQAVNGSALGPGRLLRRMPCSFTHSDEIVEQLTANGFNSRVPSLVLVDSLEAALTSQHVEQTWLALQDVCCSSSEALVLLPTTRGPAGTTSSSAYNTENDSKERQLRSLMAESGFLFSGKVAQISQHFLLAAEKRDPSLGQRDIYWEESERALSEADEEGFEEDPAL